MANSKKKDKIKDYKASTIIVDIVMLLLGLIFFIGGIAGKSQTALNNIIEMVDRGYEKTSTTLFDRAFARVA